jgi:hypothetical protein
LGVGTRELLTWQELGWWQYSMGDIVPRLVRNRACGQDFGLYPSRSCSHPMVTSAEVIDMAMIEDEIVIVRSVINGLAAGGNGVL